MEAHKQNQKENNQANWKMQTFDDFRNRIGHAISWNKRSINVWFSDIWCVVDSAVIDNQLIGEMLGYIFWADDIMTAIPFHKNENWGKEKSIWTDILVLRIDLVSWRIFMYERELRSNCDTKEENR